MTFENEDLFSKDDFVVKSERCKKCLHFERLNYRSGKSFFYCKIKGCNNTANGLKKIRANDIACSSYKDVIDGKK
jgi:hypothetical protein